MDAWKKTLDIPVSALFLIGTCPIVAGCGSACDGVLLAAAAVIVWNLTGAVLYLLRDVVTGGARVAALLFTASALAAIAALMVQAYFPAQYNAIGLYVPLTALQCVGLDRMLSGKEFREAARTLARPEMWYVLTLGLLGLLREFLGSGTLFGAQVLSSDMEALAFFGTVPGAFLTLAFLAMVAKAAGLFGEEAWT